MGSLLKPGISYPEPAFHLVHGDEVVNRGSAFTSVDDGNARGKE